MRSLEIDRSTLKLLDDLPVKHFRQVVMKVFQLLKDPLPQDASALRGHPFMRVTAGEYRVVYEFTDIVVRILAIGKRNDSEIYRIIDRKF